MSARRTTALTVVSVGAMWALTIMGSGNGSEGPGPGIAAAHKKSQKTSRLPRRVFDVETNVRFIALSREEIVSTLAKDPTFKKKGTTYDWVHLDNILCAVEDKKRLAYDLGKIHNGAAMTALGGQARALEKTFTAVDMGIERTETFIVGQGTAPVASRQEPVVLVPTLRGEPSSLHPISVAVLKVVGQ